MRDTLSERLFIRLSHAAEKEVADLIRALPDPVRREARRLPVTFQPRPGPALVREGLEPDTLGLFTGEAHPDRYVSAHDLPAHIMLFLLNIHEYAGGEPARFREEVRKTYLHELGHYLGLDEDDLTARDLD